MALQTNDVGLLFASFEKAYGHLWRQGPDALPMWQKGMQAFSPKDVAEAGEKAIQVYPDHPPTLGQFINVIKSSRPYRAGMPLLGMPKISNTAALANRVLLGIILTKHGLPKITLKVAVKLKNEIVRDFEGMDDEAFPDHLKTKLNELIATHEGAKPDVRRETPDAEAAN